MRMGTWSLVALWWLDRIPIKLTGNYRLILIILSRDHCSFDCVTTVLTGSFRNPTIRRWNFLTQESHEMSKIRTIDCTVQHYISFVGKQTLQLAITTAPLKRCSVTDDTYQKLCWPYLSMDSLRYINMWILNGDFISTKKQRLPKGNGKWTLPEFTQFVILPTQMLLTG